jgi:hypothetical protein
MPAMDDEFAGADVWRAQPLKSLGYVAGSVGSLVLFVIAWPKMSDIYRVMTIVGVAVFILVALRFFSNLLRGRQPMLAIGPRGLFDWRIGRMWIPWSDVIAVHSITSNDRPKAGLRVKVTPAFAARFPETIFSRIQRWSNSLTGLEGYTIAFGGLDADPDRVAAALDRYFPRRRQE